MSDEPTASESVPETPVTDMVWQSPTMDHFSPDYDPKLVPLASPYPADDLRYQDILMRLKTQDMALAELDDKLVILKDSVDKIHATQESLKTGVNSIGEMMNWVTQTVQGMAQQVQSGGLGALMGMMKGGKNG